jgi:cyclin B
MLGRTESKDENTGLDRKSSKDKPTRGTGACRRGPFADLTNSLRERDREREKEREVESRDLEDARRHAKREEREEKADLEEARRHAQKEEGEQKERAERERKLAADKEQEDEREERQARARASLRDPKNWVARLHPVDQEVVKDPCYVAEYAEEVVENMRLHELRVAPVPADFLTKQEVISDKMRSILVDWLVEVHLKFKLTADSLLLTVQLLDRFLAAKSVQRSQLQLVGVTCLLLAAKYVEVYAPEVRDFVNITDRAYTRREIMDMEVQVLTVLKFRLQLPSPLVFLKRFARLLGADAQLECLAQYILELSLVDARMSRYQPSHVASASLLLANKVMKKPEPWPAALCKASHTTEQSLRPCGRELCALLQGAEKSSLQAVRKKFSSEKYHSVAKLLNP